MPRRIIKDEIIDFKKYKLKTLQKELAPILEIMGDWLFDRSDILGIVPRNDLIEMDKYFSKIYEKQRELMWEIQDLTNQKRSGLKTYDQLFPSEF